MIKKKFKGYKYPVPVFCIHEPNFYFQKKESVVLTNYEKTKINVIK